MEALRHSSVHACLLWQRQRWQQWQRRVEGEVVGEILASGKVHGTSRGGSSDSGTDVEGVDWACQALLLIEVS